MDKISFLQLASLLTIGLKEPNVSLESFVRPIVPAGSRNDIQELSSLKRNRERSASHRSVLLMVEMGKFLSSIYLFLISYFFHPPIFCCCDPHTYLYVYFLHLLIFHTFSGFERRDLQTLPSAITLLLCDALYQARENPPRDWPHVSIEIMTKKKDYTSATLSQAIIFF